MHARNAGGRVATARDVVHGMQCVKGRVIRVGRCLGKVGQGWCVCFLRSEVTGAAASCTGMGATGILLLDGWLVAAALV
jgi:hypothetical protein